jgi:hypothetical protein
MSLIQTRMQNVRANSPRLSDWTLLPKRNGALAAFLASNNEPNSIVSEELKNKAAAAVGSTVEVPVWDSRTVSIGSTRTVVIADSENTSQLYALTFVVASWGFTVTPSQHMNNHMKVQEDFDRKFNTYAYQFLEDLDAACLAALEANKNQVFADLLGIYTNVANAVSVPLANRKEIFGDLNPIMRANDHNGPYVVIGNGGIESLLGKLAELGIYNETNKKIQYVDKDIYFTNNLANAANFDGTGFCVDAGSLGIVWRHEREALLRTKLPDGTMWDMTNIPGTDIPLDVYFYHGVGDYSAIGGAGTTDMTRAAKEHWGFAIEYAIMTPYNTDLTTYANPIVKFALADS